MIISSLSLGKKGPDPCSKTRLDSHAISCVVGYNAYVYRDTGQTIDIKAFTSAVGKLQNIPIVDAMVYYECPYTSKELILVINNALYVEQNEDNLLTPFLVREAGHYLSERPKIHSPNPTIDDHVVVLKEVDVRIHLNLHGIVSYFTTRKPTPQEIKDLLWVNLTPDAPSWDPHNEVFARQESRMLDFEGNIIHEDLREPRSILEERDEDINMEDYGDEAPEISALMDQTCNNSISISRVDYDPDTTHRTSDMKAISTTLNPDSLAMALQQRLHIGKFGMSVGAVPGMQISAAHQEKPKGIRPERLAKVFCIDEETAKRTIQVTTQRVKRIQDPTLDRNFSTNDRMLRYKRLETHFFTDTFFATKQSKMKKSKKPQGLSTRGNLCMQLFVTDKGYVHVVPMKTESEVHKAYKHFFKAVGVPDAIVSDGAKAQVMGQTKTLCNEVGTTIRQLERHTPWSNRAELYIGLLKRAIRKELKRTDCPLALWDYCAQRCAMVNNVTAKDLFQLEGETPHYHVHGQHPDISNLCRFQWYEWVYWRDEDAGFPLPPEALGRVLGPSINAGNQMAQWVLKSNGQIVPCRTLRPLRKDELHAPHEIRKRQLFTTLIREKLGDSMTPPQVDLPVHEDVFEAYEDDDEQPSTMPEADDDVYDRILTAELQLPHNDKQMLARVKQRHKDSDGNVKGKAHPNPWLDTRVYDVEFEDGTIKQYSANIIAQNILSQVDEEGNSYQMLDEIMEHRKLDTALNGDEAYIVTPRGQRKLKKTTQGWQLRILWKDGSTSWVNLRDMKDSFPVEVAEYSVAAGINEEPAFKWWTPYVLKKRDVIVAALSKGMKKASYKYGIRVPKTIKEAYELDRINGNDFWRRAIAKEMSNVQVAFEILEHDQNLPPGYTMCTCHIIFDVKMDGTRKARYVKDGHKTEDWEGSCYAGVVSRDSVRIALTYAALNDLDVMAADIRNAYLQAPPSERHYVICGLEFGIEHKGKRALIKRALYGGKTSGRDFRNLLRACMQHIGFSSCLADPDVWMRKSATASGEEHWEYVLLYVDDALCISSNPETVLRDEIGTYFELKEESVGPPDIYLGGSLSQVTMANGMKAWGFSSAKYVKGAIANVEEHLRSEGRKLPTKARTPLSSNYRPELDLSDELIGADLAYYQSLIGVLRWAVELGRVDICLEVSMMSSHLAMPRSGHLEELYHMFSYLKRNHNAEMVFDPSDPDIDPTLFERKDWEATEFGELEEILPENMPQMRGQGFVMTAYVDADHAADTVTRRSRTGFIVYLNSAPIFWHSKKQSTIETSSFGSEFMAMKHCTEYVRGLRYKLRMMGIPCELPTLIHGDNQSVLANTSVPDSVLKKKSNSIAYHFVREGCARDEWRTGYINTHSNPADLLTKPLPSGEKRVRFVRMMLYHIFGSGHDEVD